MSIKKPKTTSEYLKRKPSTASEWMVYYTREESFREDKKLRLSDVKNPERFVLVAIKQGTKDQVFREMQGEFMDSRTRAAVVNIIKGGGTHHQSMSVGDVLRDAETGAAFQCAMVGWIKLR
jgi:hypothetical protein